MQSALRVYWSHGHRIRLNAWGIIISHTPRLSVFVRGLFCAEVEQQNWSEQYIVFWGDSGVKSGGSPGDYKIYVGVVAGELKIYAKP